MISIVGVGVLGFWGLKIFSSKRTSKSTSSSTGGSILFTSTVVFDVFSDELTDMTLALETRVSLGSWCCSPDGRLTVDKVATLPDRLLLKLLVMLATLSFLIIEDAEERTRCSPLLRPVIAGYGRMCLVQTSASSLSSRILSLREGARTGMRFVVSSDWDLLIAVCEDEVEASFNALVFLMIT